MFSHSNDQISSILKQLLGGDKFKNNQLKKLDLLDPEFNIEITMMLDLRSEVALDPAVRHGITDFEQELKLSVEGFRDRLKPVLQAVVDRRNQALVARIAKRKLSPEQLLKECAPRLALAVEVFRREEAEARSEQAMRYADHCHSELGKIACEARERHHRSIARKAKAAARRVQAKKPKG